MATKSDADLAPGDLRTATANSQIAARLNGIDIAVGAERIEGQRRQICRIGLTRQRGGLRGAVKRNVRQRGGYGVGTVRRALHHARRYDHTPAAIIQYLRGETAPVKRDVYRLARIRQRGSAADHHVLRGFQHVQPVVVANRVNR